MKRNIVTHDTTETYLRVSPHLAAERIDGEVVIVEFLNGNYYALNDLAADIWQNLVDGHGVSALLKHVSASYPDEDIKPVGEFVDVLRQEDLLQSFEPAEPIEQPLAALASDRKFAAPVLEKHEDMQKLIMLDPIHEVDDTAGWPHKD